MHGARPLRELLFLGAARWEWLFGVENRDTVFPIHSRFKFNPVDRREGRLPPPRSAPRSCAATSTTGRAPRTSPRPTPSRRSDQFSPKSRAILEIQSRRDLEILEKIYANAVLLGDDGPDGWGIRYAQGEFNMTTTPTSSRPARSGRRKGYRPDEYSRWLCGDWRPIEELWEEMGVDPSRPEPSASQAGRLAVRHDRRSRTPAGRGAVRRTATG